MNKLPTKQIYLLIVIIVGIIALSMYSTYAIFTYESETSDVVSIELPSTLSISTDMYEYKQIELKEQSTNTTDIDIYNTFDYDLCYSIWYKVLGNNSNLVEVYELNKETITTSGTLSSGNSIRIKLLIINKSNQKEKINIGIASENKNDTCNLNISSDKKIIKNTFTKDINYLQETIVNNENIPKKDLKEGFHIYKNITNELTFSNKIAISNTFTQEDEKFSLTNEIEIDLTKELNSEEKNYTIENNYICKDINCNILYKINNYEIKNEEILINNYDILVPYQKGISGVIKKNNNYYYFGDNPNNFIKFNCENENKCELWRIIGSYYDTTAKRNLIKIIRNDSIEEFSFNTLNTNIWDSTNSLKKNLQENFSLSPESKKLIIPSNLHGETINDKNEINSNDVILDINPDIITLTDFLNASACKDKNINNQECLKNNWINNTLINSEWTMTSYVKTPPEDEEENIVEEKPQAISVGNSIIPTNIDVPLNVRPTLFIADRVLIIDGSGTLDDPYILM